MSATVLSGPGTQTVQLSHRDGFCFLHFDAPIEWVKLDPATAGRVAEALARLAYAAVAGDVPTTQARSQITEMVRARLAKRVALMLRGMESESPRPEASVQASRIVDVVMKEVA